VAPGRVRGLILVVDDDQAVVELLVSTLHDAGYEVVTASDGAALHVARERQPHLILLDLVMPGMDGVEVSRRLRADPTTAPIPIIAMSSAPQLLTALPVNDGLAKPFGLDQLCATVAYWMRASARQHIHCRDAGERSYAFDRTTRRVVASCIHGAGTQWWVVLRDSAVVHGPFDTREQARSEAEKCLLA
jgi:CheY-like chemotaxis protein